MQTLEAPVWLDDKEIIYLLSSRSSTYSCTCMHIHVVSSRQFTATRINLIYPRSQTALHGDTQTLKAPVGLDDKEVQLVFLLRYLKLELCVDGVEAIDHPAAGLHQVHVLLQELI